MSIRVVISVSIVSGKRRNAAVGSGGRDELAHEERVAARALRDLAQQFLGQGDLSSGRERQPSRFLAGERRELEHPMPVAGLVDEGQALRPARDRHEPGPRGAAAHEMEEDAVRRVVDPVRVLEDDERGHHQHAEQELLDRLEDALATERRLDLLGFRRHRHFGVEGDREQRQPGRELGHDGLDPGLQAIAGLGWALRIGDSGERAEQRAKRQVGDGHPVLVAARDELREADRHRLQLLDEARLADPRLPDELGHLALAQPRRSDGRLRAPPAPASRPTIGSS